MVLTLKPCVSAMTVAVLMAAPMVAHAATFSVLYNFQGSGGKAGPDGSKPIGDLAVDSQGRLYGATQAGGTNGLGTIFRLTRPQGGKAFWKEEVLHSFSGSDGATPKAGVVLDKDGNVFGTTSSNGSGALSGTVFKLDSANAYALSTLHSFLITKPQTDGLAPEASLTFGSDGLLYGTTLIGGTNRRGTVFSISPAGDAVYYKAIDEFENDRAKGWYPNFGAPLVLPNGTVITVLADTNLTQTFINVFKGGHVIELKPTHTKAKIKSLFSFTSGNTFYVPVGGIVFGSGDVLYGCARGGSNFQGGIYSLTPPSSGNEAWSEAVVYGFQDSGDKDDPTVGSQCSVTPDQSGNLFGTSDLGGEGEGGTIFQLMPPAEGEANWSEQVLHAFSGGDDGRYPAGSPLFYASVLYGNAQQGAVNNNGNIWQLIP